jgi:hypothetical protein
MRLFVGEIEDWPPTRPESTARESATGIGKGSLDRPSQSSQKRALRPDPEQATASLIPHPTNRPVRGAL